MSLSLEPDDVSLTALSETELQFTGGGMPNWVRAWTPLVVAGWVAENWSDLKRGMAAGWNADNWNR